MVTELTEDDPKRIERFVQRPRSRRRPDMLCPQDGDADDSVAVDGQE